MGQLLAPNKTPIIGTLESVPGTAWVTDWSRDTSGKLVPEFGGGTALHWDDQSSVKRNGDLVAVDEDGGEWPLADCTYVDDGADPEDD